MWRRQVLGGCAQVVIERLLRALGMSDPFADWREMRESLAQAREALDRAGPTGPHRTPGDRRDGREAT